ncbi:MAG TPA: type II secretion system F family protein [Enterovirga sp.]
MDMTTVAVICLSAVSAGGLAYAFLYPLVSGEARVEKRQQALIGANPVRRERNSAVNRRDQVAQSLKELDQREKARNKVTIEGRIAQAGLEWSRSRFFMLSGALGVCVAGGMLFLSDNALLAAIGLFVGGLGAPRWFLGYLKKRRIDLFLKELPNAMDIIVRGIRAGLPLGDCLRIIANETQEPVKTEFRILVEQQNIGITVGEAVGKLYERVPVAEANFFAIVIAIQQKAGGNLSEAIGNLSKVLRERKKMKDKIQAMSMEAKASAGIIASLPFIVALLTYLSSPNYIELLWITMVGKMLLGLAAFWMMCGVLVMRKMINFDF